MTEVINPSSQNVTYEYDALGRRTKRSENTNVTKFTYDGLNVVLDDDTTTGITTYQNGLGIDNKLKLVNGTTAKYFLQDHLGSTNALTDSSGNIIQSATYDSFGNSTNTLGTRYQFTGREKDDFSGLYYYRARWYDANTGRFISEDPIEFEGKDMNWFSYVHNNPLNYFDPEGTQIRSDSRWEPYSRESNQMMIQAIQKMPVNDDGGEKFQRILRCHQNNKFSALFREYPYAEGTVEFLEVGSFLSLGGDAVATTKKAFGKPFGKPQPYASGINMITRNVNRALGYPRFGSFYPYKYLVRAGGVATTGGVIIGGFTFGYNATIDVQCVCGVLE